LHYLGSSASTGLFVGQRLDLDGSQATLYDVLRSDRTTSGFLYKAIADQQLLPRVRRLVDYSAVRPGLRNRVAGVPLAAVEVPGHSCGVLIRRVSGMQLTTMGPLRTRNDLRLQLQLALDLATEVALMHDNGLVHGDISGANILYDLDAIDQPRASLVDMDMASVWDGSRWASGLEPLHLPPDGPYLAPEVKAGTVTHSSLWTDRWGLAVALHFILCLSSPLSVVGVSASEYATGQHAWPPPTPVILAHAGRLAILSPTLQHYFIRVFDRQEGIWPESRPGATAWAAAIAEELGLT